MKSISLFLFFAALIFAASCNDCKKECICQNMTLADSLLKVNEDAYNSGDPQIIANMYTDDALTIGPAGKRTWSKDSIFVSAKSMTPILKNFKAYLGPTTVTKDMVFMQKYFTGDIVPGGSTLKGKGTAILIWKKQADNSWKIVMEVSDYDFKPF